MSDSIAALILQGDPTVAGFQAPFCTFGYSFTTSLLYFKVHPEPTGWVALQGAEGLAAIASSGSASDLASGTVPASRYGAGTIPNTALVVPVTITRSQNVSSPTTSISIDVTADGDGEYEFSFDGLLGTGVTTLKIEANGADLPAAQGNSVQYTGAAVVNAAATQGAGVCVVTANDTTPTVSVKGRFSSRNGALSSLTAHFVGAGGANWWGLSVIQFTPNAVLTSISLVSTIASRITSGTFYVRKLM